MCILVRMSADHRSLPSSSQGPSEPPHRAARARRTETSAPRLRRASGRPPRASGRRRGPARARPGNAGSTGPRASDPRARIGSAAGSGHRCHSGASGRGWRLRPPASRAEPRARAGTCASSRGTRGGCSSGRKRPARGRASRRSSAPERRGSVGSREHVFPQRRESIRETEERRHPTSDLHAGEGWQGGEMAQAC